MTLGYYATSRKTAERILQNGSFISERGKFGNGYHFAKSPKYAYDKASNPEVIVLVTLQPGRCMSEYGSSCDWNLSKLRSKGYDSVQNGNEICVFETSRIKKAGYASWDYRSVLLNIYDCDFYPNEFKFLTNGKKFDINISGKVVTRGDLVCDNITVGANKPFRA